MSHASASGQILYGQVCDILGRWLTTLGQLGHQIRPEYQVRPGRVFTVDQEQFQVEVVVRPRQRYARYDLGHLHPRQARVRGETAPEQDPTDEVRGIFALVN